MHLKVFCYARIFHCCPVTYVNVSAADVPCVLLFLSDIESGALYSYIMCLLRTEQAPLQLLMELEIICLIHYAIP